MTKQRITAIAALVFFCAVGAFGAFMATEGADSRGGWISLAVMVAAMGVWAIASGWEPDAQPTNLSWARVELADGERIATYHTYYSHDNIMLARVWTLNTGESVVELNQRRVASVRMRFTAAQTADIARNFGAAGFASTTEPSDT